MKKILTIFVLTAMTSLITPWAWAEDPPAAQRCVNRPLYSACWLEVENQPGCYVWEDYLEINHTVSWTGTCQNGTPTGKGVLQFVAGENKTFRYTEAGPFENGHRHGQWVESGDFPTYSWRNEGPYENGWRHGSWVEDSDEFKKQGSYRRGKRQGRWDFLTKETGGEGGGNYVDGKKQGLWVESSSNFMHEADWHGIKSSAALMEGTYVDDLKQGPWVRRYPDGCVEHVYYKDGEKQD